MYNKVKTVKPKISESELKSFRFYDGTRKGYMHILDHCQFPDDFNTFLVAGLTFPMTKTCTTTCKNKSSACVCNGIGQAGLKSACRLWLHDFKEKSGLYVSTYKKYSNLSSIHGAGLYTANMCRKNEHIMLYTGIVTTEADVEHPNYLLKLNCGLFIYNYRKGNFSRFLNHSCDPNCRIEEYNLYSRPMIVVTSNRAIPKNEELTIDYNGKLQVSIPFIISLILLFLYFNNFVTLSCNNI